MEQGLEAPASTLTGARAPYTREEKGRGGKGRGERAIGDDRPGDADRGRGDFSVAPTLSAEGKLRRAETAPRGTLFRDREKRGEPQDRQRPARRPRRRGGESRRGGEKPRGRNADGNRHSHPEGEARTERARSGTGPRETDSPTYVRWRGDLWTTPGEEAPARSLELQGPERVGDRRQGQEGRGHRHSS